MLRTCALDASIVTSLLSRVEFSEARFAVVERTGSLADEERGYLPQETGRSILIILDDALTHSE